jgi:hypothetical protein
MDKRREKLTEREIVLIRKGFMALSAAGAVENDLMPKEAESILDQITDRIMALLKFC